MLVFPVSSAAECNLGLPVGDRSQLFAERGQEIRGAPYLDHDRVGRKVAVLRQVIGLSALQQSQQPWLPLHR